MSFREVSEALERWSAAGERCALATLVRVRGSAPRPPGARFAVSEGGQVAGSVSSGCVEGDLFERLQSTLREGVPELVHYGITDEMAADVGLACGGEIEVLLTPHDERDPAWTALRAAVEKVEGAVHVVGLSEEVRGRQLFLGLGGGAAGSLGSPERDDRARDAAGALLDVGDAVWLEADAASGDEAPLQLFAEAFLPPPRLAIVGAGSIGVALCRMASQVGYRVSVIDPRTIFADPDRFPDAERVLHLWPEEGLTAIGVDRYVAVVVLAHDAKLDVPALAAALRAGCLYVGQIGGRRTQRLRREALAALGIRSEEADRIRGPVGLDIGARTPEEIALAILAEIVAVRRGR
ncbi:MAG: XdhC family protein [Gemmatimonadota bacterium]